MKYEIRSYLNCIQEIKNIVKPVDKAHHFMVIVSLNPADKWKSENRQIYEKKTEENSLF